MRRKIRENTIYKYRKSKSRKNKNKSQLKFLNLFVLIISSGYLIILLSGLSLLNSNRKPDVPVIYTGIKPQFVTDDLISIFPSPSQKKPVTALLAKIYSAQTPTPGNKTEGVIQIAQASANEIKDYCLNVPILLYHHIEPMEIASKSGHAQLTVDSGNFEMQMEYLKLNNFHTISADELADALIYRRSLPEKSIAITMDDGYEDNYTYAYQILKKYDLTGNFIIPTGLLEKEGYMSWSQLKEISDNPKMRIYNHTFSHAYLAGETKEKILDEISKAQEQLVNNLGKPIDVFIYPYGAFDESIFGLLKDMGFKAALSTNGGSTQCTSDIWKLKRLHIGNAPLTSYGL